MAKWVKMLAITPYDLSSITRSYTMEEENQFPEINLTPTPSPEIQGPAFLLPLPIQNKNK